MTFADFLSFEKFIAPQLIKIVFAIGLLFIALSFVRHVFWGFGMGGMLGRAVIGIAVSVALSLLWRVTCEVWMVMFSINDRLGEQKTP